MSDSLDRFLDGPAGHSVPVAEPVVEPQADPVVTETPAEEPAAAEPAAAAPPVEDADDALPTTPNGTIPVAALQAEREKRNDWKAKAIRFETERKAAEEAAKAQADQLKALQAQLEELKKAPPAPPPPPITAQAAPVVAPPPVAKPDPMPNPVEDLEGFMAWQGRQAARVAEQQALMNFDSLLNTTEVVLREKEGDEAVDKAVAQFKAMVAEEEKTFGAGEAPLFKQLRGQRNPYRWMFQTVRKAEADREIGGDLTGFRARVEAELRAKIEAEMAERLAAAPPAPPPVEIPVVQPRQAPNVVLPRSLATATSAAPRSAPAWTGPTPLGDIVPRR